MPKCVIDGKEYEFSPGETIIQLADRVGAANIPRFCYHPALSVVAQCRMCAVEVEKMPKLQTACSTPLTDGMVVNTASPKVKAMQSSVMEFLLINHPLDCPICDKSGECDLQNYSFDYGTADGRYEEQRRTYMDLDMGPVIKKNMNRCIHCTRCIRFCDEVGGFREMVAMNRGNNTEITTVDGKALETAYAGNLADICPTGSLTLKDFRFKKRVWYLKKTQSVCDGCSRGCNIDVSHDGATVHRLLPRENKDVNKWWMCDEGRFGFHYVHSEKRVIDPSIKKSNGLEKVNWESAVESAKSMMTGRVLVLVGSDHTQEEIQSIQKFVSTNLKQSVVYHFGTQGVQKVTDDANEDEILRRKNKTANLNGAEKLGLVGFPGFDKLDAPSVTLLFSSGRARIPSGLRGHVVGIGVFDDDVASQFDVVLPSLASLEKDGTVLNFEGREQRFSRAIDPPGNSKAIEEVVALWR